MAGKTVGAFIRNERGISNIDLIDREGNQVSNSYESYNGFTNYFDREIICAYVQDKGNFGVVATLVI